jgi:DNA-directed RNA polymerase subunit alpha
LYEVPTPRVVTSEGEEEHGHFVIEPLERGFGITMGNALRRVILSAIPGAAITQLRMEGIPHEFSALPHVKEDVIDFVLNVKALRLRPLTKQEGNLTLRVEGEGRVCGADIAPSADFEIANPELHLATLESNEARLHVDLKVEMGKGYVAAPQSDGLPIGAIPVDAIFTPVRKVNYSVEPLRVGQQAGYERLILDIWTDGTITALEALSKGAQVLQEQFSVFATPTEVVQPEEKKASSAIPPGLYDLSIEQVGFTQSITRRLKRNKITKMGELLEMTRAQLLALDKFGAKSVQEVEECLKERGYALAGAEPPKSDTDDEEAEDQEDTDSEVEEEV